MNKIKYLYCTFAVFLIGVSLAACGTEQADIPWKLTSTLSMSDISSAEVWVYIDGRIEERILSAEEIEEVIELINQIPESAFTDNEALAGTTPEYGLKIESNDMKLNFSQNIGPYGAIELGVGKKTDKGYCYSQWHTDSDDLAALIVRLSGYKKTEEIASDTDIGDNGQKTSAGKLVHTFTGGYGMRTALSVNGELLNVAVQTDWYAERYEVLFSRFDWNEADKSEAAKAVKNASFVLVLSAMTDKEPVLLPDADYIKFFGGTDYVLLHENGKDKWYTAVAKSDVSYGYNIDNAPIVPNLAAMVRQEYDGFEIPEQQIRFNTKEKEPEAVAALAVEAYGRLYKNVSPGSVYEIYEYAYDPKDIQILDVSDDGDKFTFVFVLHVRPVVPNTSFWWAGNTCESEKGEGWLCFSRNGRLDLGEDGYWTVSQLGTGGASLND